MNEFKQTLNEKIDEINKNLQEIFSQSFDTPDVILDAMKYSLFAGGKRLRPILMIETCRLLDGDIEAVMPLAMAMEMIHTYSLIHDDLPAMDDDDLRRGIPTNHKVFGEAIAILAGDALLNFAMEVMIKGAERLTGDQLIRYVLAMKNLVFASGISGMIGGQVADMESENRVISMEELDYIHGHKTGALLEASVCCGCIVGKAEPATQGRLTAYSSCIGLAFQIVDDILDIEGTTVDLGKSIGSDQKNHKSTFVSLYGMEASKLRVDELEKEAVKMLEKIGDQTIFLQKLARYICERQK